MAFVLKMVTVRKRSRRRPENEVDDRNDTILPVIRESMIV
jgi:hypothetical protein